MVFSKTEGMGERAWPVKHAHHVWAAQSSFKLQLSWALTLVTCRFLMNIWWILVLSPCFFSSLFFLLTCTSCLGDMTKASSNISYTWKFICFISLYFSETISYIPCWPQIHFVAEDDLELLLLLSPPMRCDYEYVPQYQLSVVLGIEAFVHTGQIFQHMNYIPILEAFWGYQSLSSTE